MTYAHNLILVISKKIFFGKKKGIIKLNWKKKHNQKEQLHNPRAKNKCFNKHS